MKLKYEVVVRSSTSTSISSFNLKLWTSTSNFNFKLQLELQTRTSNFKIQLQTWPATSNFNFKFQLLTSTSNLNFKLQLKTSTSNLNFKLKLQLQTSLQTSTSNYEFNFKILIKPWAQSLNKSLALWPWKLTIFLEPFPNLTKSHLKDSLDLFDIFGVNGEVPPMESWTRGLAILLLRISSQLSVVHTVRFYPSSGSFCTSTAFGALDKLHVCETTNQIYLQKQIQTPRRLR